MIPTPAVVGLEPVAEYDDHDAELYWRKDFNIPKGITKLYSAADVAKLQAENEALRKDAERWRFFRIADWADWNAVFRVDHDGLSLPELLDKATDAAMKG